MPTQPKRVWFILNDGYSENQFSLDAMLEDNASDEGLCDWLRAAKVGDVFNTGGAAGESTLTRVE